MVGVEKVGLLLASQEQVAVHVDVNVHFGGRSHIAVRVTQVLVDVPQELGAEHRHLDVLGQRKLLPEAAHRPERARLGIL